ncbi:MAG: hypothetical protein PHI90_07780 [Clostridia bacterium]|nr:hypothetical protein [Clostridia bacterium]MDD4048700.1 hypothetical protein [Clostridia bacterium]
MSFRDGGFREIREVREIKDTSTQKKINKRRTQFQIFLDEYAKLDPKIDRNKRKKIARQRANEVFEAEESAAKRRAERDPLTKEKIEKALDEKAEYYLNTPGARQELAEKFAAFRERNTSSTAGNGASKKTKQPRNLGESEHQF